MGVNRGSEATSVKIPQLIHQTWKTGEVPPEFRGFQRTWLDHHPDWRYRLWTDEDNRNFLQNHYAWFLPIYDTYRVPIKRADAIRYFLLWHYGGLYVDLDMECLQPVGSLLKDKEIVLGLEPPGHLEQDILAAYSLNRLVCNAFMASPPGHPFWKLVIEEMVAARHLPGILDATGPILLTNAYEKYSEKQRIFLEPHEKVYPIDAKEAWCGKANDPHYREQIKKEAYTIHHWAGTYYRNRPEQKKLLFPYYLLDFRSRVKDKPGRMELGESLKDMPKISCLMVTRGRGRTAKRAFHCFQMQTYPNKELVIVDDEGTNEFSEWVRKQGALDVVYVRSPRKNSSLGELRRSAEENATGEFVARWDDDVISSPYRLKIQIQLIQETGAAACMLLRHRQWFPQRKLMFHSAKGMVEDTKVSRKSGPADISKTQRKKEEDVPGAAARGGGPIVAVLDAPYLYTRVFDDENPSDADCLEKGIRAATNIFKGMVYEYHLKKIQSGYKLDLMEFSGIEPLEPAREAALDETGIFQEAGQVLAARANDAADRRPRIHIMIVARDVEHLLDGFFINLEKLTFPHDRLSISFLEGDSKDNTHQVLKDYGSEFEKDFSSYNVYKKDYDFQSRYPRWHPEIQRNRRSILAKVRNQLLIRALEDDDYVLWCDADVIDWPGNIIELLLETGMDIVVPHCVQRPGGPSFDLNTWRLKPGAGDLDWSPYMRDGIIQPPKGLGRLYLDDLRRHDLVELDSVGGAMLLVRADIHREGLIFPPVSYKGLIETEGLARMAKDMGYKCHGLPKVEIIHYSG